MWLVLENKILMWDNLLKRGFSSPGTFQMCKLDEEIVLHHFSRCSFFKSIWMGLCGYLRIQEDWVHDDLQECVFLWVQTCLNYKELPMFVIWEVWKYRNRFIF